MIKFEFLMNVAELNKHKIKSNLYFNEDKYC